MVAGPVLPVTGTEDLAAVVVVRVMLWVGPVVTELPMRGTTGLVEQAAVSRVVVVALVPWVGLVP